MDKFDFSTPMVVFAMKGTIKYGDKLPDCPYEHGCYQYFIKADGRTYSALDKGEPMYFDKKHFYGLKKPGLFKSKLKDIELYWVLDMKYSSVIFNIRHIQGADRKTKQPVPVHFSGSLLITCWINSVDKAIEFAKSAGQKIEEGAVLFTKLPVRDIAEYVTKFLVGDLYMTGVLKAGQALNMPINIRGGGDTSLAHRVAEAFSGELEPILSKTFGITGSNFTMYSKIRDDAH